jgi:glucose/arabinose dehydrogenase
MNRTTLALLAALAACGGAPSTSSEPTPKPSPPAAVATPSPSSNPTAGAPSDITRRVNVYVTAQGLDPKDVEANPKESLTLVFERDAGVGCAEVVVEGKPPAALADGKPAEVTLSAPASGSVAIACGDAKGTLTVVPATP